MILDFKEKANIKCINSNHDSWICKLFKVEKKDLKLNEYYINLMMNP
jgi:uncharacterized protein YecT (DUF1311 family)